MLKDLLDSVAAAVVGASRKPVGKRKALKSWEEGLEVGAEVVEEDPFAISIESEDPDSEEDKDSEGQSEPSGSEAQPEERPGSDSEAQPEQQPEEESDGEMPASRPMTRKGAAGGAVLLPPGELQQQPALSKRERPPKKREAEAAAAVGRLARRGSGRPREQRALQSAAAPSAQAPGRGCGKEKAQQAESSAGKRRSSRSRAAADTEESGDDGEEEREASEQEGEEQRPAKRSRGTAQPPPLTQKQQAQLEQLAGGKRRRQRQQEAAAAAAAVPAGDRRQRGARSPTPVVAAAAQPLEMSAAPEVSPQAAAAAPEEGPGEASTVAAGDPSAAACSFLLRRLTQPRSREAGTVLLRPRLQEAYEALLDSLGNTVELGHNNSLLVLGPRGSGKTLMTERALAALEARWNVDARDPVVGVVRLSGLAHAEERTAFREAARQLCEAFKYTFSRAASVGENIEFLRSMLAALASCDKTVVFVLEEFDLFASKRSKQTLLYSLLDALQTSGMRAAVVGLTCRQDVVELLEKRVKSRFSHRKLDLSLPTSALPVASKPAEEGRAVGEAGQDGALDVLQAMLTLPRDFPHRAYTVEWNASVAAAAAAGEVRAALQRCINVYPSLRHLANIADVALAGAARAGGGPAPRLAAPQLLAAVERQLGQSKAMVSTVSGLPVLDLILLVALHRLTAKGSEDFNFEMARHEFQGYTLHGGQHVDVYGRAAAAKAYDHLLSQGLVAFVDPRSEARVGSRHYAAAYLQVTREEVEEGMAAHWNCPHQLHEWFKREGGLGTTAGQFL